MISIFKLLIFQSIVRFSDGSSVATQVFNPQCFGNECPITRLQPSNIISCNSIFSDIEIYKNILINYSMYKMSNGLQFNEEKELFNSIWNFSKSNFGKFADTIKNYFKSPCKDDTCNIIQNKQINTLQDILCLYRKHVSWLFRQVV